MLLVNEQYYLVEWRNFDGFDRGLKTPYATVYDVDGEWRVNRTPYNAPGLLIWHRNAAHTFNDLSNNLFDGPSIGSKGTLLLVDAHYQPARLTEEARAAVDSALGNLDSRAQANDAAFGRVGRYPFRYCVPDGSDDPYATICSRYGKRKPVTRFTDAKTWYPGVEYRPDLDLQSPLFFRDTDASTVVPSRDNTFYSTRVVDARPAGPRPVRHRRRWRPRAGYRQPARRETSDRGRRCRDLRRPVARGQGQAGQGLQEEGQGLGDHPARPGPLPPSIDARQGSR